MKILIAPDSFKGSLSAIEVARSISKGIARVDSSIETILVPMADGGEGTVQSLIDASEGHLVEALVHDPLMRKIKSFYGIMGDGKTAVIEMASASGLPLLKDEERNPLKASTYGTGELIKHALDSGCTKIIMGLGGSATNDGGMGMAMALGVRFLDKDGNEIQHGGGELSKISTVDMSGIDPRIKNLTVKTACDVDNPLCGEKGASKVYGRQKGASENDIQLLDAGLKHLSGIMKSAYHIDKENFPGAGAAGGMGYGVMAFLGGELESGIEIVARLTNLSEKAEGADLVITGEGKIDFQTAFGKTPFGVAKVAKEKDIPVVAIAGGLGERYESLYAKGFDGIFSIIDQPMSLKEAIANADDLIANAAESIVRLYSSCKK